jgi:hypothetical protein
VRPEEQHIIDELKKRPAEVPGEDYFAGLKSDILQRIKVTDTQSPPPQSPSKGGSRTIPLYRKTWFQIAAAASVVLIVSLFALNTSEERGTQVAQAQQPDWNSVSQEEVLAYIQENIDDFETEAIAQQLDSIPAWSVGEELAVNEAPVTTKAAQQKADKYDELFRDIDQEDILEYLEDEELEEDMLF